MDNESIQLSKGDLKVMIGIIKICLDRGSFMDEEMNKVNDLLDKLSFLIIPKLELSKINNHNHNHENDNHENIPFDKVISDLDDLPKIEELPDFFYEVSDEIDANLNDANPNYTNSNPVEIIPKIPSMTIFSLSPIPELEEEYENEKREKPKIKIKNLSVLNSVLE